YNLPFAFRIDGELDVPALWLALSEIVRRHEALRAVFLEGQGGPRQRILPFAPLAAREVDLAGLRAAHRTAERDRLLREEEGRPFDLARGPLLRAELLRCAERERVLLLTLHHIVSDGWSMGVLVGELAALYSAFAERRPSPLPPLPIQYSHLAVWQRGQHAADFDRQLAYWQEQLAAAPTLLPLPLDRPRPNVASLRGREILVSLPGELAARLKALSRRSGATLFMVLLASFQTLLSRLTGAGDLLVGTATANRHRSELEGLIGFFVNTLALRARFAG